MSFYRLSPVFHPNFNFTQYFLLRTPQPFYVYIFSPNLFHKPLFYFLKLQISAYLSLFIPNSNHNLQTIISFDL
jgi:hypothetical protein